MWSWKQSWKGLERQLLKLSATATWQPLQTHIHAHKYAHTCGCNLEPPALSNNIGFFGHQTSAHTRAHPHISTHAAVVAWQPAWPRTQTPGCQPHHNHAHAHTHTYAHAQRLWPGGQQGLVRRRPVVSHITITHMYTYTYPHRLRLWPGSQRGLVRRRSVVSHITITHT